MKMQIEPLTFQDSSIWLFAAALIIHTIAEAWLPESENDYDLLLLLQIRSKSLAISI